MINLHKKKKQKKKVIIDNNTTFTQYYSKIKSDIKPVYHTLYGFETPNLFYVKVWKDDHLKNKTIYKNTNILQFKNKLNSLNKNSFNLFRSYTTNSLSNS